MSFDFSSIKPPFMIPTVDPPIEKDVRIFIRIAPVYAITRIIEKILAAVMVHAGIMKIIIEIDDITLTREGAIIGQYCLDASCPTPFVRFLTSDRN
jgi:hypothetical protein